MGCYSLIILICVCISLKDFITDLPTKDILFFFFLNLCMLYKNANLMPYLRKSFDKISGIGRTASLKGNTYSCAYTTVFICLLQQRFQHVFGWIWGEAVHYAVAAQSCSSQGGQEAKEEGRCVGDKICSSKISRELFPPLQLTSISPLNYELIGRLI